MIPCLSSHAGAWVIYCTRKPLRCFKCRKTIHRHAIYKAELDALYFEWTDSQLTPCYHL